MPARHVEGVEDEEDEEEKDKEEEEDDEVEDPRFNPTVVFRIIRIYRGTVLFFRDVWI